MVLELHISGIPFLSNILSKLCPDVFILLSSRRCRSGKIPNLTWTTQGLRIKLFLLTKSIISTCSQIFFMVGVWLSGVFIFAGVPQLPHIPLHTYLIFSWNSIFLKSSFSVLIGNVKEIIAQSTQNQDGYMRMFDNISQYMFRSLISATKCLSLYHKPCIYSGFSTLSILQYCISCHFLAS